MSDPRPLVIIPAYNEEQSLPATLDEVRRAAPGYDLLVMEVCQHDFPKDFPDAPLLIALARRGFRLLEVPVVMRERSGGKSFYTFGKSLYYPYKNLLASLMAWIQRPA